MTVSARVVDLSVEQEELLAVLERNLADLPHARRFKWMYHGNPLGPAWSWFAWDTEARRVVGVASVFRRAVWLGSRAVLCGQVGDFAIDASHRSLGPAVMLQRATFEPVDRGTLVFCYDCPPHERGMSTFRRLGMRPTTTMRRHARLLRTDRQLARRLGGPVAAGLAPLGNALLRLSSLGRGGGPLEVAGHAGRFGEEFSALDQRVGGGAGIRGRRSAEDLNWRYRDDPLHDYQAMTARRRGELAGFAVLSGAGPDAFLVDLFGALSVDELVTLLDAVADHARAAGAETLHAAACDGGPLTPAFARSGFRLRDQGPLVVAYARSGSEARKQLDRPADWNLTHSDVMA